ncbi:hypothetical protein RhiirB3_412616 [Rhizophagus irregularis]|nr:hypothetical protein RhiirB3_412616 [Rhizophagus irregularis]
MQEFFPLQQFIIARHQERIVRTYEHTKIKMNYVKKCNKDEEFNMKIDAIDYGISEDAEKIDDIKNLIMIVMRNSDST